MVFTKKAGKREGRGRNSKSLCMLYSVSPERNAVHERKATENRSFLLVVRAFARLLACPVSAISSNKPVSSPKAGRDPGE